MKKRLAYLMICCLLCLSGCRFLPLPDFMTTPMLQEVEIDGVVYRTGFYEELENTLVVTEVTATGRTDAGNEYTKLDGAPFDLIWTLEYGFYGFGAIYCREDQYSEAVAYYRDANNFDYSLVCGNIADPENCTVYPLLNLDLSQLEKLWAFESDMQFGPALAKNPTDFYDIPMPEDWTIGQYTFRMTSPDGYFIRNSQSYRVLDGHLVMDWKYMDDRLYIIELPQALSEYFITYITDLL